MVIPGGCGSRVMSFSSRCTGTGLNVAPIGKKMAPKGKKIGILYGLLFYVGGGGFRIINKSVLE